MSALLDRRVVLQTIAVAAQVEVVAVAAVAAVAAAAAAVGGRGAGCIEAAHRKVVFERSVERLDCLRVDCSIGPTTPAICSMIY